MVRAGLMLLGVGILAGCATHGTLSNGAAASARAPVQRPAASPTGKDSLPALAARTLPAVVLIVNERKDGRTTYGAGVLVGEVGRVLTNLHVVTGARHLRVMLYRPGRATYTPMDGGLRRFLFENARDLLRARIVKRDDTVDLALLAVAGDTSKNPRLPFATRPVRVGDRVLALGHPGGSVWSFTSGVVSALPQGTIQHDAAVNGGNSGGPLIDLRGQVVGINTSKALSGTEGVAFARPISMARRLLEATPGGDVDLTDLERAVLGCFHAQELASPSVPDCFDARTSWRLYQRAIDEVAAKVGLDSAGTSALRRALLAGGLEAFTQERSRVLRALKGAGIHRSRLEAECGTSLADPRCARPRSLDAVYLAVPQARARALLETEAHTVKKLMAEEGRSLSEEAHFHVDLSDAAAVRRALRMGIRIDAVVHRGPDDAWVLLAGRNVDGSPYHLTERWQRRDGVWHQQLPVTDAEVAHRPAGWPRPMGREAIHLASYRAKVLLILSARCCVPTGGPGYPPLARRPR